LHLEFFDGVDGRKHDEVGAVQEIHGIGVVVDAVEQVVILCRAETVGGEGAAGGVAAGVGLRGVYAGGELSEEGEIPAVQRQAIDVARVDDLANGAS
jgi:hypothetical protein